MSRIVFKGRLGHIAASYAALCRISIGVWARRLLRRRLDPTWGALHEIGILFWRHQFTQALNMDDIAQARAYFDSLQTFTGEVRAVTTRPAAPDAPPGRWVLPKEQRRDSLLLYFHGGGYTFDAFTSDEFADLLAHETGARLFQADYRLTPEHPHPAQIRDAMAAYRHALSHVPPQKLILIGDSAGGHLVLMSLLAARDAGLPQPALAVGLSPWTDIGARGDSLHANDRYDLVSGWMALRFGQYLSGGRLGEMRAELSPISHDFKGLAPLYLQGGGREVLIDMIREFATVQKRNGAGICLDVWPHMSHDFFGYGRTLPDSTEALERINGAIDAVCGGAPLGETPRTEVINRYM